MSLALMCLLLVGFSGGSDPVEPEAISATAVVEGAFEVLALADAAQASTDWVARAPGLVHRRVLKLGDHEFVGFQISPSGDTTSKPTVVLTSFDDSSLNDALGALIDHVRENAAARKSLESFRWLVLPNMGEWGGDAAAFAYDFPVGWQPGRLFSGSSTERPSDLPLDQVGTSAFASLLRQSPEIVAVIALDGPDRGGNHPEALNCPLSGLLRRSTTLRAVRTASDGGWLDYAREAHDIFTLSLVDGADVAAWSLEAVQLVGALPRAELQLDGVEPLATGLWQVDLRVTNRGLLPLSTDSVNRRFGGAGLLTLDGAKALAIAHSNAGSGAFQLTRVRQGAQLLQPIEGGVSRSLRLIVEAEGEAGQLKVSVSGPRLLPSSLDVPLAAID